MSTKLQTESLKLNLEVEIGQTESANGRHDVANPTIESATDDYDDRVALIRRAFSEISKLCYWTDYKLEPEDWAILDAARLDSLDYTELRTALRYAYKQIKHKAQARARSVELSNHSRF